MEGLDEFEQAVLVGYNTNINDAVKLQAIDYCAKVKSAPDGWLFCLNKLTQTKRVEVKFFCLVVLQETIQHRYAALSEANRTELKRGLLNWLTKHVVSIEENNAVKNKFAQIVALVFRAEFPHLWPTFFQDILSCLQLGPTLIDMFLRIMKSIDEEATGQELRNVAEAGRNTEIKDFMRVQAVQDLASAWQGILATYQDTDSNLVRECLDVVKRFINWIDIGLVANDRFVPLFFKFLSIHSLRTDACACLRELVTKGMVDPVAKLSLLTSLNLTTFFANTAIDDDIEFTIECSKTVNGMGLELLQCIVEVQPFVAEGKVPPETLSSAQSLLEQCLLLLFRYMNYEDDDVSLETFKFAAAYLSSMKASQLSATHIDHINVFLQITRNKMKYDPEISFAKNSEEDAAFQEYRKELRNIYKILTKIAPQMVAAFVHSTITTIIGNLPSLSFSDVEVGLSLLHSMGDGISEATSKTLGQFFSEMIVLLASSNISAFPHHTVTLMYFDTIVRYLRYLPNNPEILRNILISFLDARGMRNPNATVRSRVCYLFQRFVRDKGTSTMLPPFLESILQGLKEFLVISLDVQKIISFDDQVNLLDAIGFLVGQSTADGEKYIEMIVLPYITQMQEILNKQLYRTDTPDKPTFTTLLSQIINAIGTFSKGFNGQKDRSSFFQKTLLVILQVLQVLPSHEELRAKVMFYMHRMIECLGVDVLQYVPSLITQLMVNAGLKDLLEFTRLLNQLMSRFKEQMYDVIDALFVKMVERLFKFISEMSSTPAVVSPPASLIVTHNSTAPNTASHALAGINPNHNINNNNNGNDTDDQNLAVLSPTTDVERDILDVKRVYYTFLSTIVGSNLINVLRSPTNAPHLNGILKTILDGCVDQRDLSASKSCYLILKRMIEQWAGEDPNTSLPGFNTFVYEQIAPLLIKQPFKPEFEMDDVATNNLLVEIVSIQKSIFSKCGKQFLDYLQLVLLPSLQVPPDLAQQYCAALEGTTVKDFKSFFSQFVATGKKKK